MIAMKEDTHARPLPFSLIKAIEKRIGTLKTGLKKRIGTLKKRNSKKDRNPVKKAFKTG